MPHYKNSQNALYFLDAEEFAHLLPADCVAISEAEAEAIRSEQNATAIPDEVSMAQAQKALFRTGRLSTVEAAIAAMPGDAGVEARIDWAKAGAVKRDNPLTQALIQILSLSEEEADELFILASTL